MQTGPGARVLLVRGDRDAPRTAIDWIAERLSHGRIIIPPSPGIADRLPARARHPPFLPPAQAIADRTAEWASLLAPEPGPARQVVDALVLALLLRAPVLVGDATLFPDLIPFSAWSMNLPDRPTDGRLLQHIGIAARLPAAFRDTAEEARAAFLAQDSNRVARAARTRRLRARRDGPERFHALAAKSAGRRPAVVYLDLLASPAPLRPEFGERLRALEPERALDLLSVIGALFI